MCVSIVSNVPLFVPDGGPARYKQSRGRDRHPVLVPAGLLHPAVKLQRCCRALTEQPHFYLSYLSPFITTFIRLFIHIFNLRTYLTFFYINVKYLYWLKYDWLVIDLFIDQNVLIPEGVDHVAMLWLINIKAVTVFKMLHSGLDVNVLNKIYFKKIKFGSHMNVGSSSLELNAGFISVSLPIIYT